MKWKFNTYEEMYINNNFIYDPQIFITSLEYLDYNKLQSKSKLLQTYLFFTFGLVQILFVCMNYP